MTSRMRSTIGRLVDAWRDAGRAHPETWTDTTALEHTLAPDGDRTFLRLAYLVLLGRPIDEATLQREADALGRGERTRAELIDEIVSSLEFRETEIVQDVLSERADLPGAVPAWPGTSERVVELPWVLQRLPAHGRLLDIGYAWSSWVYLKHLVARPGREVHGADPALRPVPAMRRIRADARGLPYRDAAFDLVACVSTIEHVGRDNDRYGVGAPTDPHGDLAALREFRRVLAPDGIALVTVPMGTAQDHGWFVQYDAASWSALTRDAGLTAVEQQAFRLTDNGWIAVDVSELDGLVYGDGVPGARGVLCTALARESLVVRAGPAPS